MNKLLLILLLLAPVEARGDANLISLIRSEAQAHGVDPDLAVAIAKVESGLNPQAVGRLGEVGLFQLRPEFHPDVTFDPATNVRLGVRYLAYVYHRCWPRYSVAWFICYNRGPYRQAVADATQTEYYRRVMAALGEQ